LILELIKQNQEFQKKMFELMKDSGGVINSNNIITTNNNKFNLNFFLNETCKDAMNLSEFVDSLQITLADLENVGKLGYAEGISRIFTKGLKELEVHKRPIHCSDLKRETVYIKNENKWEKERDQLKKAIKQITNKNIRLIPKWKEDNPGHQDYHNNKNDEYLKIMYESMGPTDEVEESKSFARIISNLAKETIIVKP
jgi:flagellar motility protein MotE (MotC chaperone)